MPGPASDPERDRRARVLGVLACAAAVVGCEALVFFYLFRYGVSNIWSVDGASQHFPALVYFHEWMTAILTGHGADYGAWSWHLGLGADAVTSLSYYLADPFALLSLFFPAHLLEFVYEGIFFLKILCAGLAGYLYLRTMKATRAAAVAGTLIYVFTSFTLDLALMHPFYLNGLILLPLVLVGTEWVLAGKRWYLLVGALAVGAASNFFIFWMVAIVAVIYAVARWFETTGPGERLRRAVLDALRVGGWYVLGAALAAGMLVPLASAVLSSSRVASQFATAIFGSAHYYLVLVVALISGRNGGDYFYGGFAVLGLLAAGVVFLRRGRIALKAMLVAFAAFAIFPVFGRLFNGLSFPSYRFYFMAGIFLAVAVAALLSDPAPLSRRELAVTGIGLVFFSAFEMWACLAIGYPALAVAVPLAIGVLAWALLASHRLLSDRLERASGTTDRERDRLGCAVRAGLVAIVVIGVVAAGAGTYDRHFSAMLKDYVPSGTAMNAYFQDPGAFVSNLPMSGLQRVDKQQGVLGSDLGVSYNNDPLVQGYDGLDYYYSIMSDGVHQYTKGLAVRAERLAWDFEGFDDRAALDTLNGVRYYIAPDSGEQYVPYGFTRFSTLGTETVYENRYALPVGYVYHSVVASATYAALPPLDKQQALLQGVVVADDAAPAVPRIQPASETVNVPYTLVPGRGLVWNVRSRKISIAKPNASAEITFAPVPDAELYVQMSGITFGSASRMTPTVWTTGIGKQHRFLSPAVEGYAWGDDTLLVDLGYFPNGTARAHISFAGKDVVRYSSLKVIAIPMAGYAKQVGALAADGMRDVKVGADSLSGAVTSHGDGVLFLSIPYSSGWSATVDGEPATIMRANVGFSGIVVTGGTHRVELHYETPGLRTGIALTLLALTLAAVLAFVTERRLTAARRVAAGA